MIRNNANVVYIVGTGQVLLKKENKLIQHKFKFSSINKAN